MIRLKNILTEQDSKAPQDNMIDIKGSAPYYTVVYRHEGKNYKIEFEDYELMDQVDDYAWSGELLGKDQEEGEWAVMCQAITLGGGDYDWEVDWDTMEYLGKAGPKKNAESKDFDIIANHANYEGKYLSSMQFDEVMSRDFVEEKIQEILDDIESGNIVDSETGEYRYDVDRLKGNIEFDCTIPIQGFKIDLRIAYDENADIVSIDVQDPDIADKFGITDTDITNKLS